MATAYLNDLSSPVQTREKSISNYILRLRLLVIKAHFNPVHFVRERIFVSSFSLAIYDRQFAASFAVMKI